MGWIGLVLIILVLLKVLEMYDSSVKAKNEKKIKENFELFLSANQSDIDYASFALAKYGFDNYRTNFRLNNEDVYSYMHKHPKINEVLKLSRDNGFGDYWLSFKLADKANEIREADYLKFLKKYSADIKVIVNYLVDNKDDFTFGECTSFDIEETVNKLELMRDLSNKALESKFPNGMLYSYIADQVNNEITIIEVESDESFKHFVENKFMNNKEC